MWPAGGVGVYNKHCLLTVFILTELLPFKLNYLGQHSCPIGYGVCVINFFLSFPLIIFKLYTHVRYAPGLLIRMKLILTVLCMAFWTWLFLLMSCIKGYCVCITDCSTLAIFIVGCLCEFTVLLGCAMSRYRRCKVYVYVSYRHNF